MNSTSALIHKFTTVIIDPLILVLFAAGLFLFMLGMVQFILSLSNGGKDMDIGRKHMIYGIIGMLIMVSVGGIISFLTNTFGIDVNNSRATLNTSLNSIPSGTFFR